jgi:hypothetical protein
VAFDKSGALRTLQLFNDKADKLESLDFVRAVRADKFGYTITGKPDGSFTVERHGPSDEAVDAFVLTYRFFVQDNEPTSFRRMAALYESLPVDTPWKQGAQDTRQQLNSFLDGPSHFVVANHQITRRELHDTFLIWRFGPLERAEGSSVEGLGEAGWLDSPSAGRIHLGIGGRFRCHSMVPIRQQGDSEVVMTSSMPPNMRFEADGAILLGRPSVCEIVQCAPQLKRSPLGSSENVSTAPMSVPTVRAHHSLPSIRLRIASSLAWLAGSYSLVVFVSMISLEAYAGRGAPLFDVVNAIFGVLCCLAGYLIWHRSKIGALLAIFLSLSTALALALALHSWFLTVTFVLSVLALVLILASWREFNWRAAA